ncbi:hypothetical protein BEL04_03285 [Mucilaginibacter sp. PPCGB 2223]|uniref:carboxypeptidase-like regulatory domain-containing protein n=1 Tax=Mucilaginibacter sp. PPCGB 2223 TaxID=1886027 RepID=UPI000824527C|nr:carboxypeptidase-like regulatory domain-containing protein [Mucilaginibacter sp. PPCGB 2223]OCX53338.1 hypothetical protein BEL04_03285 [Mucilaginibacter sp. PPCGB 2223]
MKHNIKHISILQPCTQNWANMDIVEQGRYCQSCQKAVIDFTRLDDREILEKLSSGSGICGRFDDQQLDVLNTVITTGTPSVSKFSWKKISLAAAAFIGFWSFTRMDARAKPVTEQHPIIKHPANSITDSVKDFKIITGCVTDAGDKLPLPGVTVKVKGSQYGTRTDESGFFNLKVPVSASGKCIV